jgi:hydrogenase maturation factor HypF (carbamoyltransferase family)
LGAFDPSLGPNMPFSLVRRKSKYRIIATQLTRNEQFEMMSESTGQILDAIASLLAQMTKYHEGLLFSFLEHVVWQNEIERSLCGIVRLDTR